MESTKVNDGTTRTPAQVHIHDGATRDTQQIWVHDGVAPRLVFQRYYAMGLSDSGDVSGSCSTSTQSDCSVTTGSVTVSVTNGRAPFTYAWSYVSGSAATVNSPTSAATTFSRSAGGSAGGTQYQGVYRCTVTDATGATATNDVTVTTTHTSTYVPSMSASADVSSVTGSCSYEAISGSCAATTGSVTVTPSGGTGPYTYAWANVSGTSASVNSASSATTTFTRTASGANGGTNYQGVYRCTVTDSGSLTATVDVTVSTTHTNTYVTLSASMNTGYTLGSCSVNNGNGCTVTTSSITLTPSGGKSPFTYAWSFLGGSALTVTSPTAASTTFSRFAYGTPAGLTYTSYYRCTVTDAFGATAYADVQVDDQHIDSYVAMSVSKDTDAYGSCSYASGSNCAAGTNWVGITVSNGLAPYSYAWAHISGTAATANNYNAASNWFSREAAGTQTLGGWYRCTVTDATSRTAYVDVYVQTTHTLTYTNVGASKSGDADQYYYCYQDLYTSCPTAPNLTTNSVTVTGSGGTGSYTFSWALLSGDTLTVNSPSSSSTSFTKTAVGKNQSFAATYRCTVSDGTSSAYVDVYVTIAYEFTQE